MDLPRLSNTALAGNKQHWLPVAAVIVGQVHHVGTVLRKSTTSRVMAADACSRCSIVVWVPVVAHTPDVWSAIRLCPELTALGHSSGDPGCGIVWRSVHVPGWISSTETPHRRARRPHHRDGRRQRLLTAPHKARNFWLLVTVGHRGAVGEGGGGDVRPHRRPGGANYIGGWRPDSAPRRVRRVGPSRCVGRSVPRAPIVRGKSVPPTTGSLGSVDELTDRRRSVQKSRAKKLVAAFRIGHKKSVRCPSAARPPSTFTHGLVIPCGDIP